MPVRFCPMRGDADSRSSTSKLARRSKQNVSCRRNQRYQTDVGWRTLYPNECRWQKNHTVFSVSYTHLDVFQLEPVIKNDEREIINRFYPTPYFFSEMCIRDREYTLPLSSGNRKSGKFLTISSCKQASIPALILAISRCV